MTQTPALKTQHLQVRGMDCTSCAIKIERSLQQLKGVAEVSVSVATERLTVSYNPQHVSEADIQTRVKALGYSIASEAVATKQILDIIVGGMDCSGCASKISTALENLAGVEDAFINVDSGKLKVSYDPRQIDPQTLQNRVVALGFTVIAPESQSELHDRTHEPRRGAEFHLKRELPSVLFVVALFGLGLIFEEPLHNTPYSFAEYAVFIPAYLISGWSVLRTAGLNILRGQVFDENFLMTIATVGAIVIHKLPEAVGVMLFYKVGELFQEAAVSRSRRSIQSLLEIRPDAANLKTNTGIQVVSPEIVKVRDLILIKPGERVPLDGEVLEGTSQVDTSALTGESVPRTIRPGEVVLGGMINQSGVLTVRVTKRSSESSISRILDLVENASSKKATTEKFITRFASRYTPVVVILSLAIALLPPLFIPGATHAEWVYRALILLVISCPCGLVISIPLGYFGGIGGAAKRGILIKGSTFLDTLAGLKTVVFDKTGTLTKGVFQVTEIVPKNGFTESELLELAAKVEAHSTHPIAQSIRAAYEREIDDSEIQDYVEIAGHGIQASVNGRIVTAGNDRLLHRKNIDYDVCNVEGTVVHFAVNGTYTGRIIITDELKEDAVQAIQALRVTGIRKTLMLTGDTEAAAASIANKVGLDYFHAGLLPEGKVEAIEAILAQERNGDRVAFVGDGINDAPVLARADVGIAMGALGSDAAIETADVVLMTDAPSKVAEAIQVGQKTLRIVWQNIIFAMVIKGGFIVLGIFGVATMWEAVFADIGVALMAIFNAMRVLR
ncbi:cadmium-translocating P-type ATPase [Leptolyngbya sp. FACHB-36]|nr:heavy metal translocating P-type ATPase [Leptolyngbya sp. FACHB-36]MBD2020305.1 cadmium-translocating P-type ATPase [Leptolyngbya sp. FACHB-36]